MYSTDTFIYTHLDNSCRSCTTDTLYWCIPNCSTIKIYTTIKKMRILGADYMESSQPGPSFSPVNRSRAEIAWRLHGSFRPRYTQSCSSIKSLPVSKQ